MKNILYIGNKLAQKGRTATTIDTLGPLLEGEGFKVKYASSKSNPVIRLLHMLLKLITQLQWVDLVLIDTYSTRNFWYAVLVGWICRLTGKRYVPILHGGNLPQRLESTPHQTHKFLKGAWKVVCPSAYLKDAFAKAGYAEIKVIPNSIDLSQYNFKSRDTLHPKLIWVRSFAQIYHPQMAIEVYAEVRKLYPNASLIMVGPDKDGSMEECGKLAKELGIPVQFTGLLTRKEWLSLAANCDIFLNTTKFDNLPVSLIEAMALGLPVISTDVGGIPYLIKDEYNGLLVGKDNVAEMVQAVIRLLENPEWVSSLSNNALNSIKQYSWTQVREQWQLLLAG
ncbi:glycosyltransferase family 4 protein [Nonlabens xiamenensis]|uniref:glycosyltransferase family 4 protein n=1 Tax=Nonlabens xiamenensis TaxID=2341043 RepID=UPI000F60985E|nr:glycosyltransferase family 4 protein [Nonlabens xiamenensis]